MIELIDGLIVFVEVEKLKEIFNLNFLLILRRLRINLGNRKLMGFRLGFFIVVLVFEGYCFV